MSDMLTVVAFDPGETTGYCVMSVQADTLVGDYQLSAAVLGGVWEYGQINCRRPDPTSVGSEVTVRQHAGLNFFGENVGVLDMMRIVEHNPDCVVVVEDFILDPWKATKGRDLLSPVRLISTLGFCMWSRRLENKVFVQNRSPVKTTCTDERLKLWGLYDRNSGEHARDACRHAYYFLRSTHGSGFTAEEKRWRAWPEKFPDPMARNPRTPRETRPGERIKGKGLK